MKTRMLPLIAASAIAMAACSEGTSSGTGKLTLLMTDAPFPFSQVSRVDVFVVRIDAKTAEPSSTEAENASDMSGWTTLASPNASINLLDLANGTTRNLGEATLATGTYRGFRLIIDPAQSSITLKDA